MRVWIILLLCAGISQGFWSDFINPTPDNTQIVYGNQTFSGKTVISLPSSRNTRSEVQDFFFQLTNSFTVEIQGELDDFSLHSRTFNYSVSPSHGSLFYRLRSPHEVIEIWPRGSQTKVSVFELHHGPSLFLAHVILASALIILSYLLHRLQNSSFGPMYQTIALATSTFAISILATAIILIYILSRFVPGPLRNIMSGVIGIAVLWGAAATHMVELCMEALRKYVWEDPMGFKIGLGLFVIVYLIVYVWWGGLVREGVVRLPWGIYVVGILVAYNSTKYGTVDVYGVDVSAGGIAVAVILMLLAKALSSMELNIFGSLTDEEIDVRLKNLMWSAQGEDEWTEEFCPEELDHTTLRLQNNYCRQYKDTFYSKVYTRAALRDLQHHYQRSKQQGEKLPLDSKTLSKLDKFCIADEPENIKRF